MAKRSWQEFDHTSSDSETTDILESPSPAVSLSHSARTSTDQSFSLSKVPHLDPQRGDGSLIAMRCSLPPHGETICFASFVDFEVHYSKDHTNRCLECRRNFPTEHFLNLHIEENHDALVSVQRDRGNRTYACFVEDCERKCSTPQKRRMHMIDKHMFPKDYDFQVVNEGIDFRSSLLRSGRHRRRSSAVISKEDGARKRGHSNSLTTGHDLKGPSDNMAENGPTISDGSQNLMGIPGPSAVAKLTESGNEIIEGLTGAMSSLNFVPPSVQFGRRLGRSRGGFSKA